MLDFYRRLWQAFLAAFVGSVGIASYFIKDYRWGSIIMFILASIFLVLFLIGLYYDFRDARRKRREEKAQASHEALKESLRYAHPEWTEEMLEIAAKGRPDSYYNNPLLPDDSYTTPHDRKLSKKGRVSSDEKI